MNASANGANTINIATQTSQLLLTNSIPGESFDLTSDFSDDSNMINSKANKIANGQSSGHCGSDVDLISEKYLENVSDDGEYYVDCFVVETNEDIYSSSVTAQLLKVQLNFSI